MKNMALAYGLKKKLKKMASGGQVPPVDPVKAQQVSDGFRKAVHEYAEGGEVKGVHKSSMEVERPDMSKPWNEKKMAGRSKAGDHVSESEKEKALSEHHKVLGEMKSMPKPKLEGLAMGGMACPSCGYAEGGEAEPKDGPMHEDDVASKIMAKRYSKGGRVANDDHSFESEFKEPNDFDDLALRDDLEFSDTGSNSGDEIGDEQEDKDRFDVIEQILKSRRKKDRMPSPA